MSLDINDTRIGTTTNAFVGSKDIPKNKKKTTAFSRRPCAVSQIKIDMGTEYSEPLTESTIWWPFVSNYYYRSNTRGTGEPNVSY